MTGHPPRWTIRAVTTQSGVGIDLGHFADRWGATSHGNGPGRTGQWIAVALFATSEDRDAALADFRRMYDGTSLLVSLTTTDPEDTPHA